MIRTQGQIRIVQLADAWLVFHPRTRIAGQGVTLGRALAAYAGAVGRIARQRWERAL